MKHYKHAVCNDVLGAPKGEENACNPLNIQRAQTEYGPDKLECVASFWKPTPEELAQLNANGSVQLCIIGTNHPPLSLDVIAG